MNKLLKSLVRETTPPLIFRGLRSLFHRLFPDKKKKREMKSWGERSAEWYDDVYGGSVEYRKHYTQSAYYFLWTVMADRMMRHGVDRVLDLGCGPGQFGPCFTKKGSDSIAGWISARNALNLPGRRAPPLSSSWRMFWRQICWSPEITTACSPWSFWNTWKRT